MQFQAEQAAAHPDVPLETIQRFALESQDAVEIGGRALGIGGAAIGVYSLARGRVRIRTTTDKISAAATVLGIGSGIAEIAIWAAVVPGVGEVVITAVGVGVGVTELGLLTADLVTHHAAQIEHGMHTASSFLQRNPEIAPDVAAVAALVSHRGNIVAAASKLESSLQRQASTVLRGGERASSAAVTVGGYVRHGAQTAGRRAVRWGENLASDLIP